MVYIVIIYFLYLHLLEHYTQYCFRNNLLLATFFVYYPQSTLYSKGL